MLTASSRKSSIKGVEGNSLADAKRISLLGMTGTGHNELVETIELVQGLKREHIQIENERKMLEDQWSKTLLKSMEEDVAMLKKRVEEGKREVDLPTKESMACHGKLITPSFFIQIYITMLC